MNGSCKLLTFLGHAPVAYITYRLKGCSLHIVIFKVYKILILDNKKGYELIHLCATMGQEQLSYLSVIHVHVRNFIFDSNNAIV